MRRKWIYDEEIREMVEVTPEYRPPGKGKDALNYLGGLWGDRHYDGLRATDGADISSRKKHRDYMQKTGYTTADDFKDAWGKARREREYYMKNGGSFRKQDIAEAMSKLQRR
jgi:hypothetical protein